MIKDSNGTRGISGTIKLTEEEKKNLVKTMNDQHWLNAFSKKSDKKTYWGSTKTAKHILTAKEVLENVVKQKRKAKTNEGNQNVV